MPRHLACHCCGLIHELPTVSFGQRAVCTRCGTQFSAPGCRRRTSSRTAAAAVAAFVLFWPAILCPILEIEKLGVRQQSSLLGGTIDLLKHGSWFVGGIVLLFSVVFPLTKIVLLLELSLLEFLHRRHKAATLRLMEHVGKWSMMDVMLLAFLVTRRRSLSSCDGLERFNHCGLQFGLRERRNAGLVLLPHLTGKSNAFNS